MFPFVPDPPCLETCFSQFVTLATQDELMSVLGLEPDSAESIVRARGLKGFWSFRSFAVIARREGFTGDLAALASQESRQRAVAGWFQARAEAQVRMQSGVAAAAEGRHRAESA
jgi:hypothetical protein